MKLKVEVYKMNKQKMKHNALEALMLVVLMVSVLCIEANSIMPYVSMGISAASLALLN